MLSGMLSEGKTRFDEMVASTNATAQAALRAKEEIVVNYMRQVYNIDFYSLQRRVQAALNAVVPPPGVADVYGFGKMYTRASVNPANTSQLPQPAAFTTIYNTAKTGLAAVGNAGRVLDSFAIINNSATTALLRLYYHNVAGNPFPANWQYVITNDGANGYTFGSNPVLDGNAGVIAPGVTALVNYFTGRKFTIDWYADPSVSIYPRVKYTPQATPNAFFYARLLP